MSFQVENPYTQPQNKPLGNSPILLGDHHHHDDVLISRIIPITLNLFDTSIKLSQPHHLKFQEPCPIFARNIFLNSKCKQKRSLEDHASEETMSRRNGNNNNMPKLDLKLNLSPPSSRLRVNSNPDTRIESPTRSSSVSPPSSCISSDMSMSSPESSPMVLVGCPRCLMYVMLSEDDPKCPKCKSTVLLDFVHENHNNNNNNNNNCNVSGGSKKTRKG